MELIRNILIAGIMYLAVHEGGHFLLALALACSPRFVFFKWGMAVNFKYKKAWQQRLICEAGFGMGAIAGFVMTVLLDTPGAWVDRTFLLCYWGLFVLHFWTYPWRAPKETNDFNGLCGHLKGDG